MELDEIHERDYLVWNDPKVVEWDKLQVAEEYLQSKGDETVPLRATSPEKSNPVLIFKHKKKGNLLEKKFLTTIQKLEGLTIHNWKWKHICKVQDELDQYFRKDEQPCAQDA